MNKCEICANVTDDAIKSKILGEVLFDLGELGTMSNNLILRKYMNKNYLYLNTTLLNEDPPALQAFKDKFIEVQYCPFCGRKL